MSMKPFSNTSAIILSAGNSERMGEHKALLKFEPDSTFIQKITETYLLAGMEDIIVVVNSELFKLINKSHLALSENVLLVINNKPELGRFYSLQTGIKQLKPGNYCFFQNIDNPYTSAGLLNSLIKIKDKTDIIVPSFQNRTGHPVLFSPQVAEKILTVNNFDIRIDIFLKCFKSIKVETLERNIFVNINSPEEYLAGGFK